MSEVIIPQGFAPRGFTQVGSLGTAQGLSPPSGSKVAVIQTNEPVMWRDDGGSPTTTVGSLLDAGDTLIYAANLAAWQAIQVSSAATLSVSFYG